MKASMRYHNYRCRSQCSNWNSPRRVVTYFLIICLSNEAIAIHIEVFTELTNEVDKLQQERENYALHVIGDIVYK